LITALDTNILIALWDENSSLNSDAAAAMSAAAARGPLIIAAPVYVEISAVPIRDERWIDQFLERTGIGVDWQLSERVWREASRASHQYARRRKKDGQNVLPRRIAADFLIGAHAWVNGLQLLTMDRRTFRIAFPLLEVVSA
jgi:predicted nucleic acid-binding protein